VSDLKFTAALDDSNFVRAVTNLDLKTKLVAQSVGQSFQMAARQFDFSALRVEGVAQSMETAQAATGGLAASMTDTARRIDDATQGVRDMQATITRTVSVGTRLLGIWGSAAGLIAAGAAALTFFERQQRAVAERAREEARNRVDALAALRESARVMAQQGGVSGGGIEGEIAGIRRRAEELKNEESIRRALVTAQQNQASLQAQLDRALVSPFQGSAESAVFFREQVARADAEVRRLTDALETIDAAARASIERAAAQASEAGFAAQRRAQIDLLREEGQIREAERLAEVERHEQRQREIAELAAAGAANAEQLMAMEDQLHQRRLANIDAEAQKRAQAEAERVAAEQRRIEAEELRAARERNRLELEEKSLDIAILRAKGLDDEARKAEIRLDAERRLRELELDPSRTEAEKARMERKIRELERLQLAGVGASTGADSVGGRFAGAGASLLGATFAGSERQIFGAVDTAANRQVAVAEQSKTIMETMKTLMASFTEAGVVKVSGDFGARLN
jgi:hypothetical protein